MDAESIFWDDASEKLTTLYNRVRLNNSDIKQHEKAATKLREENDRLWALAAKYEALFASEVEGTPA